MDFITRLLGPMGITSVIGLVTFAYVFKYAHTIFDWIERQTLGTREYVMERLELLLIDIPEQKVTYYLLGISGGLGGGTLLLFGVFGHWVTGIILGGIAGFIGFKIPRPIVDYLVEARRKKYQSQMVDGLQLLANGIRAGLSVPQALGMVVDELPAPLSEEFNIVLQQNKIGVPLEECLENLAVRVPVLDNEMFVTSVNILRESGGNLAEVFDTIVGVIRERVRLRQKIETQIASGKFQAMVLASMPFGIGLMFASSDPDAFFNTFTHPLGILMVVGAIVLDIIGFVIILKIINIEP